MLLGGALLLIKPGLVTDAVGMALLAVALGTHPDVRDFLRRRIGRGREESPANGKVSP